MHEPVMLQTGSVKQRVDDWFWPHSVPGGNADALVQMPDSHSPAVIHDVEEVEPQGVPSGTLVPLEQIPE